LALECSEGTVVVRFGVLHLRQFVSNSRPMFEDSERFT